jgi:hypothetical protein
LLIARARVCINLAAGLGELFEQVSTYFVRSSVRTSHSAAARPGFGRVQRYSEIRENKMECDDLDVKVDLPILGLTDGLPFPGEVVLGDICIDH